MENNLHEAYSRVGQLSNHAEFEQCERAGEALLQEPGLSEYQRMMTCIILADATDDWEKAEAHRAQAQAVYIKSTALHPEDGTDAQTKESMRQIRNLLDDLERSQRDQAPQRLHFTSLDGIVEESAGLEVARLKVDEEATVVAEAVAEEDRDMARVLMDLDATRSFRDVFGKHLSDTDTDRAVLPSASKAPLGAAASGPDSSTPVRQGSFNEHANLRERTRIMKLSEDESWMRSQGRA